MSDIVPNTSTGENLGGFEEIRHIDDHGVEFWYARDLGVALGYERWETFSKLVSRAKIAMARAGLSVENHFRVDLKMVSIGYGNMREIEDVRLTRHACYLVAQNGNPAQKPRIAQAQVYFATQTRKQELREQLDIDMKRLAARLEFTESDKRLSSAVMEQDISPRGLGVIKKEGDQALFGGKSTSQMKKVYGITKAGIPWADRAPNVVLAAKSFANAMTATNIEKYGVSGYDEIRDENNDNNASVRETMIDRGIVPETEPPAEDTKVIERRVKEIGRVDPKNLE